MRILAAIGKWFLGTTVGRWIVGIGAVLAALAVALYVAFRKGKHAQADTDAAKDATEQAQAAQQVVQAATTRQEVEHETEQLPAAPAQTVATADPHSAAGQLRDDGWLRDDPGKD